MAKYTFKGYSFSKWFVRNKDNFKLLIVSLISLFTALSMKLSTPYNLIVAGIVATISKLAIDAVDFYSSP